MILKDVDTQRTSLLDVDETVVRKYVKEEKIILKALNQKNPITYEDMKLISLTNKEI